MRAARYAWSKDYMVIIWLAVRTESKTSWTLCDFQMKDHHSERNVAMSWVLALKRCCTVRLVQGCHRLATKNRLQLKFRQRQTFGVTASQRDCGCNPRQLANRQNWRRWLFVLMLWRWFTYIRSLGFIFHHLTHRKLCAVPMFDRSMPYCNACCNDLRLYCIVHSV